jgi:hypothetical protein
MIILVGFLIPVDLKILSMSVHQQATIKNCIKVKVTGYLNVFMICLAVLLDKEEETYHIKQQSKNLEFSERET